MKRRLAVMLLAAAGLLVTSCGGQQGPMITVHARSHRVFTQFGGPPAGTLVVGDVLTVAPGHWSGSPSGFRYQWNDCDSSGAACTNAAKTPSNTSRYVIASGDTGFTIRAAVTAHYAGHPDATVQSQPTGVVSGATWPSTYFDGPLGNNEVLPAVHGHTLLSAIVGGDGVSASATRALIKQRETDMGRNYDLIGEECFNQPVRDGNCSLDLSSTDLGENFIHSQGAIPYVQWDPGTNDYASVAAGDYDSNIDAFAKRFKAFGHRVMVRMWWEYNGGGRGTLNPTHFVNGWRHTVTRIQQDGGTNIGFIWCPSNVGSDSAPEFADVAASYPGNAYVDWSCSDQYNWDTNTGYSTPYHNAWAEFDEIANFGPECPPDSGTACSTVEQDWGPEKPYFVGETGSKYDTPDVPAGHTVDPNRKKHWFISIKSAAANMPYMIGISFFDSDVASDPEGGTPSDDWRVDSNCDSAGNNCALPHSTSDPNTYSGFLSMADSSQFSGGVAGRPLLRPPGRPVLSVLTLSPERFRAAPARPTALPTAARKYGTLLSYHDSQAAVTTVSVQRPIAGTLKHRRCVTLPKRAKPGPRHCTFYLTVKAFTHIDNAGLNHLRFTGRIAQHKLPPGRYRLLAIARSGGRTSMPRQVGFQIKP